MTGEQTCAGCRFWQRRGAKPAQAASDPSCPAELGTCRAAPPVLALNNAFFSDAIWPRTHEGRWCGRWTPATAAGPGGGEVIQLRSNAA